MEEGKEAGVAREVTGRVLRRLHVLEYVILGVTAVLAMIGGAILVWLFGPILGTGFRTSWIVASLLFFLVPGIIVLRRERQLKRENDAKIEED